MSETSNERFDRIEATLDRIAALLLRTAGRQSRTKQRIEELRLTNYNLGNRISQVSDRVDNLVTVAIANGESIRALARNAEARKPKIEDLENRSQ